LKSFQFATSLGNKHTDWLVTVKDDWQIRAG